MAKVRLWFLVMYIKFIEAPPRNLHSSALLRIPAYCASGVSLLFTQQMPYLATAQCVTGEGDGPPLQDPRLETPMDGGAWWAAGHGVVNSRIRLSNFTFTFHFHALEKELATHSSVVAWRIPGTGEPGGLPSMGSHRVGHD